MFEKTKPSQTSKTVLYETLADFKKNLSETMLNASKQGDKMSIFLLFVCRDAGRILELKNKDVLDDKG